MSDVFRILSMDGGDGRITARLLQRVENVLAEKHGINKAYLSQTDIFVGASAGGINSLLLAHQEDPDAYLELLEPLWQKLDASLLRFLPPPSSKPPDPATLMLQVMQGVFETGLALVGVNTFFTNRGLQQILGEQFNGATLGDLERAVAIVSFQLDAFENDERRWAPRVFTNFHNKDDSESCLDVALRSSAQPVELPVFQSTSETGASFIDGGYVANNPAMVGLSYLASAIDDPSHVAGSRILVFSVGAGVRNFLPTLTDFVSSSDLPLSGGSAPWGYIPWLANVFDPVLLLNVYLQSHSEEVAFQVGSLVGKDNFFRLDPKVKLSRQRPAADVERELDDQSEAIEAAADWLVESGWFEDIDDVRAPAPAAMAAKPAMMATMKPAMMATMKPAMRPVMMNLLGRNGTPARGKAKDLTRIEGIGPKIAAILQAEGIDTPARLAKTPVAELENILASAGSRYQMHDPSSWPKQAELIAAGEDAKLEELQDTLKGGRRR